MTLLRICLIASLTTILYSLLACSNSDEQNKEDVFEKTTDKIAREAIEGIRDPINKAKAVSKIAEDHTRGIKETTKEQ
ncbi:hypothetical protein [Desulfocastanea catecholica]